MRSRQITLFHAPQSRSTCVLALLEALAADYQLQLLDLKTASQLAPEYRAINPMGKVPAIVHDGALVTEQVAIHLYLADLYPEAGLAPALEHPLRGPYLRWMVFHGSCFEPSLMDVAMRRDPPPRMMSPYADAATVLEVVEQQLAQGPWLLGETHSAADILWGMALGWTSQFGLFTPGPATAAYIARTAALPAIERAQQRDAELVAG